MLAVHGVCGRFFYDSVNNEVMYYICYQKKKKTITHACTKKIVNFVFIHVCMYVL